jgi:hypothetical protein
MCASLICTPTSVPVSLAWYYIPIIVDLNTSRHKRTVTCIQTKVVRYYTPFVKAIVLGAYGNRPKTATVRFLQRGWVWLVAFMTHGDIDEAACRQVLPWRKILHGLDKIYMFPNAPTVCWT